MVGLREDRYEIESFYFGSCLPDKLLDEGEGGRAI